MLNEIKVTIISMVPALEYRAAIPLALFHYHLSVTATMILVSLGSLLVFFPLYFGLATIRRLCEKYTPSLVLHLDKFIDHAHKKIQHNYEKYGALALCIIHILPVPFAGVWTLTTAAVALKIPFKQSFLGITGGGVIGAALLTFLFTSVWNNG